MFRWGICALWLACTGCSTTWAALTAAAIPSAKVEAVSLRLDTATTGTLRYTLQVPNARRQALAVREVDWTLWLDRRPFAHGLATRAAKVTVSGVETTVELEAPLAFLESPGGGFQPMRLEGRLTATLAGDERTFVFDHAGALKLEEAPLPSP